jgi:hypothetical protein
MDIDKFRQKKALPTSGESPELSMILEKAQVGCFIVLPLCIQVLESENCKIYFWFLKTVFSSMLAKCKKAVI